MWTKGLPPRQFPALPNTPNNYPVAGEQSPLDYYFASLGTQYRPEPGEDGPGPGSLSTREPSYEFPEWLKHPSIKTLLPDFNPSAPRETAPPFVPSSGPPAQPVYNPLPGNPPAPAGNWSPTSTMRPPAYTPANPGNWSPTSTMRPPGPATPPAATPTAAPPDLNKMLLEAQIDNLTSTGNAKPADLSGLEGAAAKLAPNKWETLMRFGLATAAGESPHFGVNVGAGGISALDARDQGLARYNTAMQNIAQMKETSRNNIQRERTDAIIAATPPARGSTAVSPVLKGIIDTKQAMWAEQAKAINDPSNMAYISDPAARAKALAELDLEIANFYAALGVSGDTPESDLSVPG